MKASLRLYLSSLILAGASLATSQEEQESIDHHLAKLKSPDAEIRERGLRGVMTSLDPRIPAACLKLLKDPESGIRRNAARSIGSRYHQIAENQRPLFVEALRENLKTDKRDEKRIVIRAIDLLKRSYESEMVSRSADKRWVIYERRHLPCLIDTKTDTEELLGWPTVEQDGLG